MTGTTVTQRSFSITRSSTTYTLDYWGNGSVATVDSTVKTIVVVIHGDNRDADNYTGYAMSSAVSAGVGSSTLVVGPRFLADVDSPAAGKLFWTDESWKDGDESLTSAWTASSFDVLDTLITAAANRTTFPNLTRVNIIGHSAGGQFVQRYVLGTRQAAVPGVEFRYMPMNSGTYAYLDNRRYFGATLRTLTASEVTACPGYDTWKYGLAGLNTWMSTFTVSEIQTKAATTPTWVLLGDGDTDPNDSSLNTSCAGMHQGAHRLERGTRWVDSANAVLGSPASLHEVIVSGIGHDGQAMIGSFEARSVMFVAPASPVVRSASQGSNSGGNLAVTKPAGLATGDLMVAWHYADNDATLAAMDGPAGWTLLGSEAGVSGGHPYAEVWSKVATSTDVSATSFTFTNSIAGIFNNVAILAITAGTYDTTTPIASGPAFQNGGTTASTSHVAPSVTGVVDGLLCTSHGNDNGGTAVSYTPPGGMTERADLDSGWTALEVNTEVLIASGPTNSRTATASASSRWKGSALVIAPAVGGGGGGGGGPVAFRAASEDARTIANSTVPVPPTGTTVGDLLLAVQVSDFRGTLAAMTAPAGWVEVANNSSRAADVGFVKVWQKTATASEPASYTFADSTAATSGVIIVALTGWDDTDAFIVDPTFNSGASSTTHPTLDVTGVTGGMLVTAHIAGTNGTTRQYTSDPTGMTIAQDSFLSASSFLTLNVYYQALTASSATGSKIATLAAAAPFVTMALVVQPPGPKLLNASGIVSSEAFGTPTVDAAAGPQTVTAVGIGTAEALGVPVVTVVVPLGSSAVYPDVTLFPGATTFPGFTDQVVVGVGISSAESFGVPDVTGGLVISPAGLGTAETVGAPSVTVAPGTGTTLYPSSTTFLGPTTFLGASGLGPYPGTTTFPSGTIYPGEVPVNPVDQTVSPTGIDTGEAFGALVVTAALVVFAVAIDTGEAFGAPAVLPDQIVSPTGIASGEALGAPVVSVANAAQTVIATAIDTAEAFGSPTVAVDVPALNVFAAGVTSEEAFGRPFISVEVPPPVAAPTYVDTYFIDGIDLSAFAWQIETSEGLVGTPGTIGDDVALPGRDGLIEVFAGLGQQRRPDALGRITFNLWLVGVDPSSGNISVGGTAQDWFARWDTLVRMFHRRRVTIDHPRPDGSNRRATAYLLPGESMTPSLAASSPWFGRFKATFAIAGAHWTDTATVTTGQQSLTTGGTLSLAAFSAATAPCTELTVTFGAGNNPRLSTSWGHIGWNGVIASGQQLGIDTATGITHQAAGSAWTPGYAGLTFSPGPRLFEIDPSEPASATLTHTGGGSMTVEVSGKRRYRTS